MKIFKVFLRLLALPFIMGISLIAAMRNIIILWIRWVRFGGELMTWDEELNPKTIASLLDSKIKEQ